MWIECSIGLIGKILWCKQTNYFCIHAKNIHKDSLLLIKVKFTCSLFMFKVHSSCSCVHLVATLESSLESFCFFFTNIYIYIYFFTAITPSSSSSKTWCSLYATNDDKQWRQTMTIKNGLWQWSSPNCHDLWLVIWTIQCYDSNMILTKIFIKNRLLSVEHVIIHFPRMVLPTWSTKSHFLPRQSFFLILRTILSHW